MKYGVLSFVTDQGIRPAVLGRALEERGFESLFVPEHTHIPASRRSPFPGGGELETVHYRVLDPFVALTVAATVTSRLVVGTGIALLTQRDPISTAKEVASLDLVSGGRVAFGVGWNREEMENHGTDPRTRGRLMDERIEAMRRIWTEEQAEFHGEFVNFDPIFSWPKPVQQPHPPIYFGGGEATFPRIARFGAGWLPNVESPDANGFWRWSRNGTLTGLVARVRVIAEAVDELDPDVSVDSSIVRAHQHAAGARKAVAAQPSPGGGRVLQWTRRAR